MIRCKVTYDGPGTVRFRRAFNKAKATGFEQMAIYWHKALRPKHFTKAGASEYGYAPRQGERGSGKAFRRSYQGQKLAIKGHTLPLVYSGESKDLTEIRDIRLLPAGRGVRVSVGRARGLNRRHKSSKIRMADEMTTISEKEGVILVRILNKFIGRWLKRNAK